MLKKVLFLILVVIIYGLFSGCDRELFVLSDSWEYNVKKQEISNRKSGKDNKNNKKKNAKKIKIGFAALDESVDFHLNVKKSVIKNCEKYGVSVITVDNKGDPANAVRNADYLIMQGVDVLVEFNTDAATNSIIKKKCDSANIPILGVDIPVPNSPIMGADNIESGRLVGRTLGELAMKNWGGTVDYLVLIDLPRSGEIVKVRMDNIILGVREIIHDLHESKIIRFDGKYNVNVCEHMILAFLEAHPDAHHILIGTLSDTEASGALAAIKKANRDKDCFMVSHGVSTPAIKNLRSEEDNCWKAGVAYFPEKYGDYIVPAAIKMAKGGKVPEYIPMKHIVITKDNIDKYYPNQY